MHLFLQNTLGEVDASIGLNQVFRFIDRDKSRQECSTVNVVRFVVCYRKSHIERLKKALEAISSSKYR